MKIAINRSHSSFRLSEYAFKEFCRLEGLQTPDKDRDSYFYDTDYQIRTNENLIKLTEDLGIGANGEHSKLKVVEIHDDVDWEIRDYDGAETVYEKSRSWK